MKSFVIVSGLFFSTAAMAADIPLRSAPLPPARSVVVEQTTPFFVGVHVGRASPYGRNEFFDNSNVRLNARAGVEVHPFARLEANYEYSWSDVAVHRSNTVTTNLIGQYRFGSVVPYVLVGGGYRWANLKDEPVFNVGGGVRYEFARNFEADARYRYVSDRNRIRDENVVTLGLNYKF
jgi:opacity protein-like surface antigen